MKLSFLQMWPCLHKMVKVWLVRSSWCTQSDCKKQISPLMAIYQCTGAKITQWCHFSKFSVGLWGHSCAFGEIALRYSIFIYLTVQKTRIQYWVTYTFRHNIASYFVCFCSFVANISKQSNSRITVHPTNKSGPTNTQ